ncbi:DNA sulfur modification protein DndB [Thomasclavelia cocleata]|uniref:DNA sulfur modification protein DndB n=1 Tax=Thomasclavelia cocleata TaxID=69824 RepID=UPI00255A80BF|nr:DNA sulfur modification protein DndB [Thomasclavelia cocleata]
MDFVYRFPVAKGIQAKREYYIGMVPLKMIPRLFPSDNEYVLPEYRAQRRLNTARIPVISKYILDNRNDYVFSALAASIDGNFKFISTKENADIGVLEVSMDAVFLINDGQHRKAAILEALSNDETLGDETISVVFFEDKGLERSQQIFTDLNKHAVKTSNSIAELYDSRNALAVITRNVISKVPFISTYTDKEKDILGKYSSNLFTLNTFYSANKRIIQKDNSEDALEFLTRFWTLVAENMMQWNELQNKEISKVDLRENYIITQAVVIQSLGRVGNYFFTHKDKDMATILHLLREIDWRRSASEWKLRTIRANGRMINSDAAIILTANVIKKSLNIPLDNDESMREKKFLQSINK